MDTITDDTVSQVYRFGPWEWSVHALTNRAGQGTVVDVPVQQWVNLLGPDPTATPGSDEPGSVSGLFYVDWDVVDRLPQDALNTPVFIATLVTKGGGERLLLVDGWHRIALARRLGRETIPGVLFDADLSASSLTPRSVPYPGTAQTTTAD